MRAASLSADRSCGGPWIDDLEACTLEVARVARGDNRALGSTDRGDLALERADLTAGSAATGCDRRIGARRRALEEHNSPAHPDSSR